VLRRNKAQAPLRRAAAESENCLSRDTQWSCDNRLGNLLFVIGVCIFCISSFLSVRQELYRRIRRKINRLENVYCNRNIPWISTHCQSSNFLSKLSSNPYLFFYWKRVLAPHSCSKSVNHYLPLHEVLWQLWFTPLHNEELSDLYSLPNILRMVKSRRIRWAGHVARMGRGEGCTGFWWGNLRERDKWGEPDVDGRIILKWIFRK